MPYRAFTLFDLLVTVAIIAMTTALIAPQFTSDEQVRLIAGSSILRSDIEYAQVLNISFPDDPVVVRFDSASATYWIATAADPDVPIAREDTGEPYLITFGAGRAASAAGVTFTISDIDDATLGFNAQGGVLDIIAQPQIRMLNAGRWIQLDISATTGSISETHGNDAEGSEIIDDPLPLDRGV